MLNAEVIRIRIHFSIQHSAFSIMLTRVILIVLDSVGVGELPDAASYGDEGSNTLGNISRHVRAASAGVVQPRAAAMWHSSTAWSRTTGAARRVWTDGGGVARQGLGDRPLGVDGARARAAVSGVSARVSRPDVIAAFEERIGRRTLGNKAASGTAIIDELGPEHIRTGAPIVYTSADSVFQIAAHEDVVPVPELYRFCEIAFELVGRRSRRRPCDRAGRSSAFRESFQRTANRRDFALTPFAPTLLDLLTEAGIPVVAIGKIEDLFAGRGMSQRGPHDRATRTAWTKSNARSTRRRAA